MKKYYNFIFILMFFFLISINTVFADSSGTGGIGTGGANAATGSGEWYSSRFGFYIAVFDSNGIQKGSTYKSGYFDPINNKNDVLYGWIAKNTNGSYSTNPKKFYEYLNIPYSGHEDNYNNLLWFIKQNGITLSNGDYVLVEPFTWIGTDITFRGIANASGTIKSDRCRNGYCSFQVWYHGPAALLASSAKVGKSITVNGNTYTPKEGETCTQNAFDADYCGYKTNKYVGYGIIVVKYSDIYKNTTIKVKKAWNGIDASDNSDYATIGIYSDKDCKTMVASMKFNASKTYSLQSKTLPSGTYYISEDLGDYKTKYRTSLKSCTLASSDNTVINTKLTCESEFSELSNIKDMKERIKLYNKYGKKALLNLNNVTKETACDENYTCTQTTETACLSGSDSISNFNKDNISCYMKKFGSNNNSVFCAYSTNFTNQLGKISFSGLSGQLYIKSDTGIATKNEFNLVCYTYNLNAGEAINAGKYTDYVKNVKLGSTDLKNLTNPSVTLQKTLSTSDYAEYKFNTIVSYQLPAVYVNKGNGKILSEECNTCKFLAYGKYSGMTNKTKNGQLVFSYNYLKSNSDDFKSNSSDGLTNCRYDIYEDLIKDNKPTVEYRSIETTNSFPGISGNGRNTGRNWCNYLDCSSNNNLVKTVMTKNDSTNKAKEKPIYSIKLTVDDIEKIRKYNKETTYDDYNFTCEAGICHSKFLIGLREGVIETIKAKESLTMSNKLIFN